MLKGRSNFSVGSDTENEVIDDVRNDMGKGPLSWRRVHNCVGGDVVEMECRETGRISWAVVVIPKVFRFVHNGEIKQAKMCALIADYRLSFWR